MKRRAGSRGVVSGYDVAGRIGWSLGAARFLVALSRSHQRAPVRGDRRLSAMSSTCASPRSPWGSSDALESFEPAPQRLGSARYPGADLGLASLRDLALLSGMYDLFGSSLHSVAVVGREGVRAAEFMSSYPVPLLQPITASLPELAAQIDARDYAASRSNLAMQAVAVANVIEASTSQGIRPDLMVPVRALLERRVATAGRSMDDVSAVVEEIEEIRG